MLLKVFIVIALVAMPLAACQEPQGPETVTFRDRNLEAAISDALGKPVGEEITSDELAELTTLRAERSDITDLSGLEYCTNLTGLYLDGNQISDISPLVENSGLGVGVMIYLRENKLDLNEGSEDIENINVLKDRGVEIHYY